MEHARGERSGSQREKGNARPLYRAHEQLLDRCLRSLGGNRATVDLSAQVRNKLGERARPEIAF